MTRARGMNKKRRVRGASESGIGEENVKGVADRIKKKGEGGQR